MPPGSFIPLAEQLGLIAELGECVLRRAVSELLRLRAELNDDNPGLFVNVSPAQLLEPGFADLVRDVIDSYGLPPKCLRLEVTENMLIDESPAVLQTIDELRAAGACIVLDDFGSGYASLATLMRVPFDGVKLDRSIVSRLGIDDEAPHQIRAIIELIHSLRVAPVIAEGVETEEQRAALAAVGCPMVQGWLFGRPARVDAILAALRSGQSLSTASPSQPASSSSPTSPASSTSPAPASPSV